MAVRPAGVARAGFVRFELFVRLNFFRFMFLLFVQEFVCSQDWRSWGTECGSSTGRGSIWQLGVVWWIVAKELKER